MKANFILVDFENVQPTSLKDLKDGGNKVRVFLGASQTKITLELAQALQSFGAAAKYVQITGNGSNALDFHIAFYLGRLSMLHPEAGFIIVSRDTGFDPLVKHLVAKGIACQRVAQVADIPKSGVAAGKAAIKPQANKTAAKANPPPSQKPVTSPKPGATGKAPVTSQPSKSAAAKPTAKSTGAADSLALVIENLRKMQSNKPRTIKSLDASIGSWFKPPLTESEISELRVKLAKTGRIKIDGTKVSYSLT